MPRSPDRTPCDFFLWGYLKNRVYQTPPQDMAELRARIIQEVNVLRDDDAMVRQAVQNMRRRFHFVLKERVAMLKVLVHRQIQMLPTC